jgi:hypothetical protein
VLFACGVVCTSLCECCGPRCEASQCICGASCCACGVPLRMCVASWRVCVVPLCSCGAPWCMCVVLWCACDASSWAGLVFIRSSFSSVSLGHLRPSLHSGLGRFGWFSVSSSEASGRLGRLVGLGFGDCRHSTGVLWLAFPGHDGPGACVACFMFARGSRIGVVRAVRCGGALLVSVRARSWYGVSRCDVVRGAAWFVCSALQFHAGGARGFVRGGALHSRWLMRVVVRLAFGVVRASWCVCGT